MWGLLEPALRNYNAHSPHKNIMIEIPTQLRNKCPVCDQGFGWYFLAYGDEAQEKSKTYTLYQILKNKIWGIKKPRSVKQLNTYWACCNLAAEMLSDHENILSKDDVDFDVKTRVAKDNPAMIKRFKIISGITYIEPISVAFANLKHLEACKYFDKAFPVMSKMVNLDSEELIMKAQEKMG